MIRHIVLLKLKDGYTRQDPRVLAVTGALSALGAKIPQIRSWETHWCFGERPVSHDFALVCEVDDAAALHAYLTDPQHRTVAAELNVYHSVAVADFEF